METVTLRIVTRNRVFGHWEENCKKEAKKRNGPVKESRLLQKYKDFDFYNPDNQVKFVIHPGNMEYQRGRNDGWMAIGIPPDDSRFDEEPFQLGDMLIGMIANTDQADNITMM